jgi:hypothetical protein
MLEDSLDRLSRITSTYIYVIISVGINWIFLITQVKIKALRGRYYQLTVISIYNYLRNVILSLLFLYIYTSALITHGYPSTHR